MKSIKFLSAVIFSLSFMIACNSKTSTDGTSPGVNDTTSANPTTDALDYHPDQRQEVTTSDSSNTIGTDTINGSTSAPNTGTQKSYNDSKGNKDSAKY